jgi:hypothetical protein
MSSVDGGDIGTVSGLAIKTPWTMRVKEKQPRKRVFPSLLRHIERCLEK